MSTQLIATLLGATCCGVLPHVGCCWLTFKNGQIWANSTQHVATRRKRVAKRTQYFAHNNVAICCVDMLRSFDRGLTLLSDANVPIRFRAQQRAMCSSPTTTHDQLIVAKRCLRHSVSNWFENHQTQRTQISTVTNSPFSVQNSNPMASRLTPIASFPSVFFQL